MAPTKKEKGSSAVDVSSVKKKKSRKSDANGKSKEKTALKEAAEEHVKQKKSGENGISNTEAATQNTSTSDEKETSNASDLAVPLTLEDRLRETSSFFNDRIKLIPREHYFAKSAEEEVELSSKFAKNKKQKAPKQLVKEASKRAKRARLDPTTHTSVIDVQNEVVANAEASENGMPATQPTAGAPLVGNPRIVGGTIKPIGNDSHEVLKERLREQIQVLKGNRKDQPQGERESKKGKKAKAKEVAAEKAKQVHLAAVARDRAQGKDKKNGQSGGSDKSAGDNIIFSKFELSTAERVGSKKKRGPSNPMQLLAKATSMKEKVEKIRQENPEKAKNIEEKQKWTKALLKAEGVKVKDDEQLLKKTIKRKEQAKKKTKKEWSERLGVQKKFRGEKQKKRTENLKARSSAKIEKRINRGKKPAGKKPKKRPGFEGGPSKSAKKPKEKLTLQGGYKNV
eukprot:m.586241 g.586241  ORF g.586241 m.586241 type:complete len:454 (+) comp22341_c0_seq5:226-1587(+)